MLNRNGDEIEIDCDTCPYGETFAAQDFHQGIAELRIKGWLIQNQDGHWFHYCPNCHDHQPQLF